MLILRSVLLLFLLVALSAGEAKPETGLDKPMTFELQNSSLSSITEFLSTASGMTVQVDSVVDQRGHTVSLKVKGMTCRNVLVWVSELTGTTFTEQGGQIRISEQMGKKVAPKPDKVVPPAMQKSLDALVTTELKDKALDDALDFLSRIGDLTIVVSPRLRATKATVTITGKNVKLSAILDQIAKSSGATWVVRNQAVFLDLATTKPAP